ncbi:MAG: undecaprenyl-diphosphatase UppP [Candidatus Omnitrophota bacterium]
MSFFDIIIFGVVEGITEFLPVSSTGHLILTAHFLRLAQTDFLKSFEITIQLGAILSVVVLYWRTLFIDRKALARVFIAFIPTVVLGVIFYKVVKNFLLSSETVVLVALLLGGIVLIIFELFYQEKQNSHTEISGISIKQALIIGACQVLAMIPGVSRSLATILAGLSLGLRRKTIVQFSFLLAIPTMLGATVFDFTKSAAHFTPSQFNYLALGFIVSFIVALMVVKFFVRYIEKHNFILFGIYRIIAFLLFFVLIRMR